MRLMLVDPHPMFRHAMKMLLQTQNGIEVVAEAGDELEAMGIVAETRPEVIIIDSDVTSLSGIELARQLLGIQPPPGIVSLGQGLSRQMILTLFRSGVLAVVSRACQLQTLLEAIDHARQGRRYLCPLLQGLCDLREIEQPDLVTGRRRGGDGASVLSQRERQVLQLLSEGMSNKEMAQQLEVSVKTIDTHRQHIMDKLNLRTVAELTKYALRQGLTTLV